MHIWSLLGKREGKRPLGKLSPRWKGDIKIYLKETELEDVNWIYHDQERDQLWALVKIVVNIRCP
jgi:hypothetical protein